MGPLFGLAQPRHGRCGAGGETRSVGWVKRSADPTQSTDGDLVCVGSSLRSTQPTKATALCPKSNGTLLLAERRGGWVRCSGWLNLVTAAAALEGRRAL